MKDTASHIIFIKSLRSKDKLIPQILVKKGYQVKTYYDIESVEEKILNKNVDLVICENNVNGKDGFSVYKRLMKLLRNFGIPFFLILDRFEKEDMLLGLEIGIDNYLVYPLNEESICYKIENQLTKSKMIDSFESENFMDFFSFSSVAMFFLQDNKIHMVNEAFSKLVNGCGEKIKDKSIETVFNISKNKQNELNYRRFQNEITHHCKLYNLTCFECPKLNFDLSFYRGRNNQTNHIFAEMIPSNIDKFLNNDYNKKRFQSNVKDFESSVTDVRKTFKEIKLTKRETEVFELSSIGLPIKLIAGKLNLSVRTVEKHRANIMAKTNAKNIIEAIIKIQKQTNSIEFHDKSS